MLQQLPSPSNQRLAIRVTPAAERAIRRGHPWLFADAIRQQSQAGRPGDLAIIFDRKGRFLAVGLYDPFSPIRVRVLQALQSVTIDDVWYQHKIEKAANKRRELPAARTNGYRLVHGENDGLPGLVIDRYDRTYVLKLYSLAWIPHLDSVMAALSAVVSSQEGDLPHRVVLRLSRAVQAEEDWLFGLSNGVVLTGPPLTRAIGFVENGLLFEADVARGQKTGFFLDQRENRARLEKLTAGKRVLNLFSYTGGFSLYAARGGATRVISVDSSQPALAAAVRNFQLNQSQPRVMAADHELLLGDAFRTLSELQRSRRTFDIVVIDPPSFANSQDQVEGAGHAYARLVRLGLPVLRRKGILVICSCSARVTADLFYQTVHETASQMGRPLQEIERTAHAIDHPIGFREGAYLKALFAIAP